MEKACSTCSVFGFVIPDIGKRPWTDAVEGIRQRAEAEYGDFCIPLCFGSTDEIVRNAALFARLCARAKVSGAFLQSLPDKKDTKRLLAALRRVKIPAVVLRLNESWHVKFAGCDVVTLKTDGRISSDQALSFGSIAYHAMRQRVANYRIPPADLVFG